MECGPGIVSRGRKPKKQAAKKKVPPPVLPVSPITRKSQTAGPQYYTGAPLRPPNLYYLRRPLRRNSEDHTGPPLPQALQCERNREATRSHVAAVPAALVAPPRATLHPFPARRWRFVPRRHIKEMPRPTVKAGKGRDRHGTANRQKFPKLWPFS